MAAVATTVLLVSGATVLAAPASVAATQLSTASVSVAVGAVSPTTPSATNTSQHLTFTLTLVNRSGQSLAGLSVEADRGNPIISQQALDSAIAKPVAPNPAIAQHISPLTPVVVALAPTASTTVSYATTSGLVNDGKQLCICADAIYPIFFSVHFTDPAGQDIVVGTAQTYLPAFDHQPQQVQVSWLWPIIDRPHRLLDTTPTTATGAPTEPVFTDDQLATSAATGRLARVLQVAAQVTLAGVSITLVVDPELIDELAVMSTGKYRYQSGTKTLPGTGAGAATRWLADLRTVLARPGVELDFTSPADPDIQSLTDAGLAWQHTLSVTQQAQVTAALGGHVGRTDVVWPTGETLDEQALTAVARSAAKTVVLNSATLPPAVPTPQQEQEQQASGAVQTVALAPLATGAGPLTAAVTSSTVQRYVSSVLSVGGAGLAQLPQLTAQLALHAIPTSGTDIVPGSDAQPGTASYVLITPPRYVNPSSAAAAAIEATARSTWATPLTLGAAHSSVAPQQRAGLAEPSGPPALPASIVAAVKDVASAIPALQSMLLPADAATVTAPLPGAVQRAESSWWAANPSSGTAFANRLRSQVDQVESGVSIQRPATGAYTLASRNSPLPLTIDNRLPYSVRVKVRVQAALDVSGSGFSADPVITPEIAAGEKLTLKISTHVERTGRFQVEARLLTPTTDQPLGPRVLLSVHSTALGAIGVVITIVAGAVLVLALLIRFWRRWRRRGRTPRKTAGRHSPPSPTTSVAG